MDNAFRTSEHGNGFWITFRNGNTVSVQFGVGNYSDMGKTTAEVAAWDRNGDWLHPKGWKWHDDVQGRQTPEDVARFIAAVASM